MPFLSIDSRYDKHRLNRFFAGMREALRDVQSVPQATQLPLEKAISIAGGQSALARKIGGKVRQGHIWYWLNEAGGRVPAEYCATIEKETGVPCRGLRPDVFGGQAVIKGAT
ncbi:MAG: helix-turn-helix domain-containing protein [Burkholderiales bacterium]|jgi:DNA-binding transcriptional regulator YdaS (Cro superfamily)|nr:helix-turn-helix domain-containing protein [Burkholderiales bacterium]